MLAKYPPSPAPKRSLTSRAPRTSATALALAGLLTTSGQPSRAAQPAPAGKPAPTAPAAKQAAQPAPAGKAAPAAPAAKKAKQATPASQSAPTAQPAPAISEVMAIDAGRVVGTTTPEKARHDGLTVIDLSDDWLPYVFSEEPDKPQPLRPYLIDLANERFRPGSAYARARADRHFEAFGIFPSLNLLRRRLADSKRHACHEKVKDDVLNELSAKNVIPAEEAEKIPNPDPKTAAETPMITTGRTVSPRPLTALEKKAVMAMQAHLRCEDLLSGRANGGRMDRRTVEGLKIYQRLQMIADSGNIELETRTALLGDSREQDFRALLRGLRERVVDATGLIEDGSAMGVQGQVQGRVLDSSEFRPLPTPAASNTQSDPATPAKAVPRAEPAGSAGSGASREGMGTLPGVPSKTAVNVTPAPDLIAPATQAASQALGWTSPDAVLASTLVVAPAASSSSKKPAHKAASKAPAPLPPAVAIRLPPLPSYHSPKMELRAEIDRGEVIMKRPALDKEGHKKWHPPVADRPTITLYAHVGKGDVALGRWPTTIGGWKTFEKSDGSLALKYKESVTGDAIWPEVLATPTWHPATGMPTRRLLVKVGDAWVPKTEIIGPGYRAAYGLVALVHHQIEGYDEHGQPQLVDHRIRTHGTPGYRAVKRGESNGCHRLHNYVALRLADFLLRHHENVRQGLVPEDYVRHLQYKGQDVDLESETKGYRFQLTPPVPVTVLTGEVHGKASAVRGLVPLNVAP